MVRLLPILASVLLAGAAAPPETPTRYVPATGWRDQSRDPPFHERWFGSQLMAMNEPPLASAGDLGPARRRFRLLVLPSFSHGFAFRIDESAQGRARLRIVMLDGRGGYAPGHIARESSRTLSRREIARIDRAIDAARLRTLPMQAPPPEVRNGEIVVCADGTAFVFELLDRKGRAFLYRNCDRPETPLRTLIGAVFALDPKTNWQAASGT